MQRRLHSKIETSSIRYIKFQESTQLKIAPALPTSLLIDWLLKTVLCLLLKNRTVIFPSQLPRACVLFAHNHYHCMYSLSNSQVLSMLT